MNNFLALRELTVQRGNFVLGPISLDIPLATYMVVLGPSGAGKTLLLESILGWVPAQSGEKLWFGQPFREISGKSQRVAYLSQHLPLLPHLSVKENLLFGLACRGERVEEGFAQHLLEVLGLSHQLTRKDVSTLSRGEQQRLALAQALLTRPQLLLLDEPSTALDPHRKPELWQLLRRLHQELGLTVLHVTHDRQEAFYLGQLMAVVLEGKLQQLSTPAQAYQKPANVAVARFLAPENLWPVAQVSHQQGKTSVHLAQLPVRLTLAGEQVGEYVGIRPEEVALIDPHRQLRSQVQENVFSALLEELVVLDGQAQLQVRTQEGLVITMRLPLCPVLDRNLAKGQLVSVCLKARSLYLLPNSR